MRCATAWFGAWDIDIRFVARRRRVVIDDDGRTIVTPAEGNPGNVKLRLAMSGEIFAGMPTRALACAGVVLDFRDRREGADRIGERFCKSRIADRDRSALGFIGIKESSA
jgi:hypothetical protein